MRNIYNAGNIFLKLPETTAYTKKACLLLTTQTKKMPYGPLWYQQLDPLQQQYAWSEYLHGKAALQLAPDKMPQLATLDKRIASTYGIRLAPAEGLLDTRDFHGLLSHGVMPCTQFIRHHANPAYTPEPDAVHDVLGHFTLVDE